MKNTETSDSGCWEWRGYIHPKFGYGYMRMNVKKWFAHRLSFHLFVKDISNSKNVIMHSCDNRSCVNPTHLKLGTQAENIKDMIYKNRKPLGEKLSFAKLKEEDVIMIRNVFDHTKENRDRVFQNLANELKVSRATIYKVGFRKNWKHI